MSESRDRVGAGAGRGRAGRGVAIEAVGGWVGGSLWTGWTWSAPAPCPAGGLPSCKRREGKANVSLSYTDSSGDTSLSSPFQKSPRLGVARDCQDSRTQRTFIRVGVEDRVKLNKFLRHGA